MQVKNCFSSLPHTKLKYSLCNGMSKTGQEMEQFQADIAAAYSYKPLPDDVKREALALYLEKLPSSFQGTKREAKGGYEIQGKRQPLYLRNGECFAKGYSRIIVGNYGAFLEIEPKDILGNLLYTKPEEAYRETEKYRNNVKYFWKTVGNTGAKIYEQRRGVSYADYKPGCYYISPYEVLDREECLEKGLHWKEEFEPFPEKASPSKEGTRQRPISCDPSLYEGRPVVFDFETTGLHPKTDEPLQLSIVNEDGKVIFESLLKPYRKQSWKDSEKVHHITPEMVMGKPHLDEYSDALRVIFEKASEVVGHNVAFDLRFLEEHAGITVDMRKVFDTCKEFRKREPNTGHKLTDAVAFYCPERAKQFALEAHNALYDTIATAAVYKVMREKEREEIEYE